MINERVLVVDDNDSFRGLMQAHLQRHGFQVEAANDGIEALERVAHNGPYAVMVSDMMMPRMNGLELVREARRIDPHLQIVVITAATTLELAIAAMRGEGAFDYLLKPLETIGELSLAVERAVAHRMLQLERQALQERLARQVEQLQTVVYYTGDAILAADGGDVLTVANPAATRLLGHDQLVGQPARDALPQVLHTLVLSWRSTGDLGAETYELHWPTDRVQSVSLAALPSIGAVSRPGWVMVLRDVTHLQVQA
jgi:CheY-like chemotaxis protein